MDLKNKFEICIGNDNTKYVSHKHMTDIKQIISNVIIGGIQ